MVHLLSLMIIGLLLVCPTPSSAQSNYRISPEEQDDAAKLKRADELLQKALFVEVEFTGNKNFSSQTLLEQMERSYDPNQSRQMILAGPVYLDHLWDDISHIRFFLGTKGYLQAEVGELEIKDLGERIAKVTLPIKEGACYRIGQVSVKGASVISPAEIIEVSSLKPGEIISATAIQDNVYKGINDLYRDRGYIQASVDFVPKFNLPYPSALEGIVDVSLEVDEGRFFFIRSIHFLTDAKTDGQDSYLLKLTDSEEQVLRDLLLIKEGEPYSRQKFNGSLRRLTQLGQFEEIHEKDVIVRSNDHDWTLDIDFRLTRRANQ